MYPGGGGPNWLKRGCFCKGFESSRKPAQQKLGGGFKYVLFSPLLGEMIQFDKYSSNGLVQPPTRKDLKTLSGFLIFRSRVPMNLSDVVSKIQETYAFPEKLTAHAPEKWMVWR